MTTAEMNEVIQEYCDNTYCVDCAIKTQCDKCGGWFEEWHSLCVEAYETITKKEPTEDIINHPKHYNREGAMESIDEMVLVFGKEAVKHFCLCNAWKYRYRAADKNGEEDMKKSDWYIRKYKELCEHGRKSEIQDFYNSL